MTELRHLGALAGIEFAATGADEDLQRLVALSHRDRMALAIVIGNVRRARGDLLIGVARAQKHRAAADEGRARRQSARRAEFCQLPGDRFADNLHRRLPRAATSVENEAVFAPIVVGRIGHPAHAVDAIEAAEEHLRRVARIGEAVVGTR